MSGIGRNVLFVALLGMLAACGGTPLLSCDEVRNYQLAREHRRVEAPEGLTSLNPEKEMPLPEASPRDARPEGAPCLDLPPSVLSGEEEEEAEE